MAVVPHFGPPMMKKLGCLAFDIFYHLSFDIDFSVFDNIGYPLSL